MVHVENNYSLEKYAASIPFLNCFFPQLQYANNDALWPSAMMWQIPKQFRVDKGKETLAGMNSHFNPGQRRGGLILRDNLEIMNIHNLKK